jgi:predicted ester cyclase
MVEDLCRAFPDARLTIQDTVAAGDRVASRVLITGTHTGPVVGFAPTGRTVAIEYLAISELVGRKLFALRAAAMRRISLRG